MKKYYGCENFPAQNVNKMGKFTALIDYSRTKNYVYSVATVYNGTNYRILFYGLKPVATIHSLPYGYHIERHTDKLNNRQLQHMKCFLGLNWVHFFTPDKFFEIPLTRVKANPVVKRHKKY